MPAQALYLMNNPWVIAQARHAARRLLAGDGDDAAVVRGPKPPVFAEC